MGSVNEKIANVKDCRCYFNCSLKFDVTRNEREKIKMGLDYFEITI